MLFCRSLDTAEELQTSCHMRCTDDLRIQVHQAAKRCVIPEVGEHPSNQIRKEDFMGEAAFELELEGVTFGMWL